MNDPNQDRIDNLYDHGLDTGSRTIWLSDDIDETSITKVCKGIHVLSDNIEPIRLIINSNGGDVIEALRLVDVIESTSIPIHTIVRGECCSCAVVIAAAGTKGFRYAAPNSIFMMHQMQIYPGTGKLSDIKDIIKFDTNLNGKWFKLMKEHTGQDWNKICGDKDHYFDSDQAIDYGIIDKIWPLKKSSLRTKK